MASAGIVVAEIAAITLLDNIVTILHQKRQGKLVVPSCQSVGNAHPTNYLENRRNRSNVY